MIQTYFPVPEESRERYRQLVSRKEYRKVQELELTWADRLRKEGREEGREEGLQAGLLQGKRQTLNRLLVAKFGGLSKVVEARIDALASVGELDRSLDLVLTAASVKDLGLEG